MKETRASIFNNVLGPIMRGPSSSHVAGAARIARLSIQLLEGNLMKAVTEFDKKGSLATTYVGHGTDIGLVAGLMGWRPEDDRIENSLKIAKDKGIEILFKISDYDADHPNTYRMTLYSDQKETINIEAISTGGGMIVIKKIGEIPVDIAGDIYELLLFTNKDDLEKLENKLKKYSFNYESSNSLTAEDFAIINIKMIKKPGEKILNKLNIIDEVFKTRVLEPVLPVKTPRNINLPFVDAEGLKKYISEKKETNLFEMALLYEKIRGNSSKEELISNMNDVYNVMKRSIENGLTGTQYEDRILGQQSHLIKIAEEKNKLINTPLINNIIANTMAVMESKSSMGMIVASPTAGACGVLPGTVFGAAEKESYSEEIIKEGLFAAGLVGVFIAENASFAGEEGGCQFETGSASAMAAAGLVQMAGGNVDEGLAAASIALQNVLGLICDPVGNRVEVPCLGRNVMAASNAIISANMALAGVEHVIPLDEVIKTLYRVGLAIPSELRCTGLGGLSVTKTAQKIENGLMKGVR